MPALPGPSPAPSDGGAAAPACSPVQQKVIGGVGGVAGARPPKRKQKRREAKKCGWCKCSAKQNNDCHSIDHHHRFRVSEANRVNLNSPETDSLGRIDTFSVVTNSKKKIGKQQQPKLFRPDSCSPATSGGSTSMKKNFLSFE